MSSRRRTLVPAVAAFVVLGVVAAAPAKDFPSKVPTADQRGRELYVRHCHACHGPAAAGDGPMAASLVAKVPDLTGGIPADRDPLVQKIMRGDGGHPGFEQSFHDLKPWDGGHAVYARNVLDYMDRLAKGQASTPPPKAEDDGDDEEEAGDVP